MHRASYYEVGPYAESPSPLQGSWVGAADAKKTKKSWGERLRLGSGSTSKEDRKSREKEMALELLQNKYYLQEYRDRYGSVSPATAATILQEGPPGGPMRFSNPWTSYGSIAVRHPQHQLLVHQPPSRIPTFRGEDEPHRPAPPVPPPSASPLGPRVLCPCGGGAEKGASGTRSRKKGTLRAKGCALCGGGGTVRLPTKGVVKDGTVASRAGVNNAVAKAAGGTVLFSDAGRRPALEGLFAASTAGAATVPTARAAYERPLKAPAPIPPTKPIVDPYDVMRRTRLVRPPESNTLRVRSKSSSPNRGRRNKRRMWGVREWPSEGEEEDDSGEEGVLGWEEDEEDERDEGAGRKSILECEVSAYELLSKYLKKGDAVDQDKRVAKERDEVLSMDDLSDELSDNALEDEPRNVAGSRNKGVRSDEAKLVRDRKVAGVRNGLLRVPPEGYGSEGEEARPTRPPRRSRTPAKESRCLPLHSAPPPPPPPPLPPPPPPPPNRTPATFLPQSAIKSILKKTAFSLPVSNSDPLVTMISTSAAPQPSQPRFPANEEHRRAKKDATKKQVQFKATHDVVTVPALTMEEEGADREEVRVEETEASKEGSDEEMKAEESEGESRGEAEGVEEDGAEWKGEGGVVGSATESRDEDDGDYEDVALPTANGADLLPVKDVDVSKESMEENGSKPNADESQTTEALPFETYEKGSLPPVTLVLRKIQSEILIGTENDLCRTNALRHSLDERPEPGRERGGNEGDEGITKAGPSLFNDTMRLRLKVHRPQARRAFASQSITPRPRMLSPPPRPKEPPPPPPPGSSSPTDERRSESDEPASPSEELPPSRLPSNPPPPAPPRQIFPFTPDEIARINGDARRWSGRLQQKEPQIQRPSRPLSWSPASGRDSGSVTVLHRDTDRAEKQGEEWDRGREGKKSRTVVTLGGWKEDTPEAKEDSSTDLKWRVLVEQQPRKTSILISGEPQVINRRDDNTLTISVAGGGGGVTACGVYVATEESKEDPPYDEVGEEEAKKRPPLPSSSPPTFVTNQECLLVDPVEAVRRNLVPHVCGKTDDGSRRKESEEDAGEFAGGAGNETEDAMEVCDEEEKEESIGEVASEGTIEDTVVGSIGTGSNEGDGRDEDVHTLTEKSSAGDEEEEEEDDHYEAVGEPIYEEIGESKEEKSIFEGASKYDILSYLVGARARGIPLDSEFDSLGLEEDLMEVEDFEEEDEEDLVIPLSLRNVGCRASHLSDSSEDSRATPSPLASMIGNNTITAQDKRRSSAEIERNDSGVGSETSKSSRSRWQQQQPKSAAYGAPPSSDTSSSASTLSSSASTHSSCSSSNGRVAGRVRVLAEEDEKEDESSEALLSGDEVVGSNPERHLCEDCDQPVETQVTDGGLMFAPLVCRKCGKRRSERREIIAEIVETEAKYGRDLRILLEEFERPMRVAGLLSAEQLAGIFLNTEELATASSVLVSRLRDALEIAIESGDEDLLTVNVGRVFLDAAPTMLHAFQSYCTRQGTASVLLSNLEKEKELLRVFLRVSQMENAVLRRMNLNSFLMVPVQRVTKYPLLLGRLFKVTPPHAEGRELIRQAQRKIELHLEHMNAETKDISTIRLWRRISIINGTPFRRSNSETDMQNIRLKKMALDVLEWNPDEVRFPVEGKLHYTQPTDSKWRKGQTVKLTAVNALLVTHGKLKAGCHGELTEQMLMFPRDTGIKEAALLLVKEKCNRYTLLREPMFLDRCIICKEMDWDDCFEVQELSTKDTYIFKGEGMEVTRQWYQELQYHALGLGPWRKRRNALANIMINSMARS